MSCSFKILTVPGRCCNVTAESEIAPQIDFIDILANRRLHLYHFSTSASILSKFFGYLVTEAVVAEILSSLTQSDLVFSFQAMAFTSLGVVLISTLTFVLGTFPEFQSYEESGTPEEYPEAVLAMEMIDNVLVGFFVIEYVVRFS